ncbi:hypothetical protein Fmac_009624 [Flemingia macrophylla]|uniref:Uncharacterized protein n=1 Tax=Flemingia macrophylla TaxID=520843 RepID=A0ABD1N0V9_9FABA
MEQSNGFVDGETQKSHPKMPSNSFPIPLPGSNRQFPRYNNNAWKRRATTLGNVSGANEKPTLKV